MTDTRLVHLGPSSGNNYYWVVACNNSGCSAVNSSSPEQALDAAEATEGNRSPRFITEPTLTVPENTDEGVVVSATDDDAADTVSVYAITGGADGDRFRLGRSDSNRLEFEYDGADYERPSDANADNVYEVQITATSGTGSRTMRASQSFTVTVTDIAETPSSPAAPTVSTTTQTTVTIAWTEPSNSGPPVHDYDIQYRPDGTTTWNNWPHTGSERTATITGLTTNITYDVRVRAASPEGIGEWSPSVWATAAEPNPPARPTNVRWAQISNSSSVRLSWNEAPKATYYQVYHCSTIIESIACTLREIESNTMDTEYTHSLGHYFGGTLYVRYAVRACNGTGCSSRVNAN